MIRRFALGGLLLSVVAGVGCSMCKHPYDYCGAVIEQDGYGYGWAERRGSILGSDPRMGQKVGPGEVVTQPEPTPAAEALPNDAPPPPPGR